MKNVWWTNWDSNPDGVYHCILSAARLPIPPYVHILLVDLARLELATPCLQGRCSPN